MWGETGGPRGLNATVRLETNARFRAAPKISTGSVYEFNLHIIILLRENDGDPAACIYTRIPINVSARACIILYVRRIV